MRSQSSLSQTPALARSAKLSETQRDQRSHRRCAITLNVEYKLLNKGRAERLGSGRTLDISTGGVLFKSNDASPRVGRIELMMTWPFSLEGVCPLKLAIHGWVVRNDGYRVAIKTRSSAMIVVGSPTSVERHEFYAVRRLLSKGATKSCLA